MVRSSGEWSGDRSRVQSRKIPAGVKDGLHDVVEMFLVGLVVTVPGGAALVVAGGLPACRRAGGTAGIKDIGFRIQKLEKICHYQVSESMDELSQGFEKVRMKNAGLVLCSLPPVSRMPGMLSTGISLTPSLKHVRPGCTWADIDIYRLLCCGVPFTFRHIHELQVF